MTKRILAVAMMAVLVVLCSVSAFAATEPKVTSDAICYISFQTGNNDYDGQTVDTPKKQFLNLEDAGCISVLADGGTLIASGKAYIGGSYVMPELGSTLKITSNDGKHDYKNDKPFENPVCAMKMKGGATLTLQQDTIIDDIILFQESAMNTIIVTNNSTLLIGDKTVCMDNPVAKNPCYMAIEVEKGSTVILNGGIFEQVTGDGTIINNGATIKSEEAAETTKAEETTKAPAETTKAPADTKASAESKTEDTKAEDTKVEDTKAADTKAADTKAADTSVSGAETTDVAATEETTTEAPVATEPADEKTTEESKETEPASSTDTSATEPAAPTEKTGLGTGAIIGIIAAVVVVIAVVVIVIVKKKK